MISNTALKEIEAVVGSDNIFTKPCERMCYRFGNVIDFLLKPPEFLADCIVRPKSAKDVSAILKIANSEKIPVTAWGGGTDFTGANSPIKGGIVLDMKSLNKIEVDTENLLITAEAGCVLIDLTNEAEKHNLLFPHELTTQASATVGGCIATNSFGHRSGSYRSISNLLMAIEFVLPTGEIIKTKPLFRNSMGYDLASLMVGSEGTLGVITEATFRLLPQPQMRRFTFYLFDSIENGIKAAKELNSLVTPEYFDLVELSLLKYSKKKVNFLKKYLKNKAMEDYIHSKYVESSLYGSILTHVIENIPTTKTLSKHIESTIKGEGCLSIMSLGFEGPEEIVKSKSKTSDKIAEKYKGLKFEDDTYYKKRFGGTLEHIREMLTHLNENNPEENYLATLDLAVPISQVEKLIKEIHLLIKKHESIQIIDIDLYSHLTTVGIDFYVNHNKRKDYEEFMKELKTHITETGGSLSFAHGVGVRFLHDLDAVFDENYLNTMRKIKKSLDPNNILNPGKMGCV